MDRKYFIIGALLIVVVFALNVDAGESSIPPTPAVQNIGVQTDVWYGENTTVTTSTYNDQIYFVSDGSITFNVTQSYP